MIDAGTIAAADLGPKNKPLTARQVGELYKAFGKKSKAPTATSDKKSLSIDEAQLDFAPTLSQQETQELITSAGFELQTNLVTMGDSIEKTDVGDDLNALGSDVITKEQAKAQAAIDKKKQANAAHRALLLAAVVLFAVMVKR